jgi:hypothetical protein
MSDRDDGVPDADYCEECGYDDCECVTVMEAVDRHLSKMEGIARKYSLAEHGEGEEYDNMREIDDRETDPGYRSAMKDAGRGRQLRG